MVLCRMARGMKQCSAAAHDSDDKFSCGAGGGMFGFSDSDVEELLCQGIMPWDDCAPMALAVLNGYDDFL